jgi:hypothetical protein
MLHMMDVSQITEKTLVEWNREFDEIARLDDPGSPERCYCIHVTCSEETMNEASAKTGQG